MKKRYGTWFRSRKAQTTVEYMLVFLVVLMAIIYAVRSVLQPAVNNQYNTSGNAVNRAEQRLANVTQ
jgi:uncharacterized protein (UPF0333 family)